VLPPPDAPPGPPKLITVQGGTHLYRLHQIGSPADQFRYGAHPTELTGGRFDSVDGSYGILYAGEDQDVAIAEVLTRGLKNGVVAARLVPRATIVGRAISQLTTTEDLTLLSLCGRDLTLVGADLWLTKSDASEYLTTRAWAERLRAWCPDAAGFVWMARHDENRRAYALFSDRPPGVRGMLQPSDPVPVDTPNGLAMLRRVLREYNAGVADQS
jgi:hypothetical protein